LVSWNGLEARLKDFGVTKKAGGNRIGFWRKKPPVIPISWGGRKERNHTLFSLTRVFPRPTPKFPKGTPPGLYWIVSKVTELIRLVNPSIWNARNYPF